jgi:CRISPR/Cas system Type II protein with McrA/HNH and RuvC-like nuclease domain
MQKGEIVNMINKNYYIGIDIGTDSVGYAVANENYSLCKFKGEPMWGVTLFDEAQLAVERRNFRVARRRLDRRQQRVHLVQELFAREISRVDENFYKEQPLATFCRERLLFYSSMTGASKSPCFARV